MPNVAKPLSKEKIDLKVKQMTRLVDSFFLKPKVDYVLIIPGMKPWPQSIAPEVAYNLSSANWISFPLVIRQTERAIIEFIICARTTHAAWEGWIEILDLATTQGERLNVYQRLVHNHMVERTAAFKELLENQNSEKPLRLYIPPHHLLIPAPGFEDYNKNLEAPLKFEQALDKALRPSLSKSN